MFQKAQRSQSKLRLCISGPSGSGKTTAALVIADTIKGDGRIAVIDTENGSASLYADQFDFDVLDMAPPFEPERFVEAIKEAEQHYSVIIVDSATHEWDGDGGCLEINEEIARSKFKGNTWSAWSDTTKRHQKFISALTQARAHVIVTARSKTETAQTQEGSKKSVVRLGMKLVQRDNFEYEFTLALDLVHDGHFANPLKDRTGLFMDKDPKPITAETGEKLLGWLNSGKSEEEILETAIQDIKSCESMEQLEDVYKASFRMIHSYGEVAQSKLRLVKDEMKETLSKPVLEAVDNKEAANA